MKLKTMTQSGHVARMGKSQLLGIFESENHKGRENL